MCSSGLEALSCPFSTKFLRNTDLRYATSTAIATYTLLPAGVLVHRICKPMTLLIFIVIVVLVCGVAYFLFSKGRGDLFLFNFARVEQTHSLISLSLRSGSCCMAMCMAAVLGHYFNSLKTKNNGLLIDTLEYHQMYYWL